MKNNGRARWFLRAWQSDHRMLAANIKPPVLCCKENNTGWEAFVSFLSRGNLLCCTFDPLHHDLYPAAAGFLLGDDDLLINFFF